MLVQRPSLIKKLQEGQHRKLTLVSAPAGYGKTTLLRHWITTAQINCAWVSLDETDNHPKRFLTYLIAALQTIAPEIGSAMLEALQSPQPIDANMLLPPLINDIARQEEMTLVLDDYHLVQSMEVHTMLDFLLRHLPVNFHLVIATRADPPLPLSRMRGRQQLTELRAVDLRFSSEEAHEFLNHINALTLSENEVSVLNERTDGWITGLQMAVLSMPQPEETQAFIRTFTASNRYILDYLLEEVLDHQPESIQSFLLSTSILSSFCSDLCTAVTQIEDCQALLYELERKNLFMIPLDHQRKWFRYHHLFANLLQNRMKQQMPQQIPKLHLKASQWYEKNGQLEMAIDHALLANEYDLAMNLIDKYSHAVWEHGNQSRFTEWMEKIPLEIVQASPRLVAIQAYIECFAGNYTASENFLQVIEKQAAAKNDPLLCGMIATTRATTALYKNEIDAAEEYIHTALDCLPANQHRWRTMALSIYGDVCAFHGHVPTCERIWQDGLQEAKLAKSTFFSGWLSAKLVFTQRRLGRLQQAQKTYQDQMAALKKNNQSKSSMPGAFCSVYGDILVEWNHVDEALPLIEYSLNVSERQGYTAGVAWSLIAMVNAMYAKQDTEGTAKALQQLEERLQQQNLPEWTKCWYTAWKVRLLILQHQWEKGYQLLQERQICSETEITYPHEVEFLACARLQLAQGIIKNDPSLIRSAKNTLDRLHQHLTETGWQDKLIETEILLALLYQARGQDDLALDQIKSVLQKTEPEGYLRTFLQEGAPMAQLLYKALNRQITPVYITHILKNLENEPLPKSQETLIEPLSSREIDVLRTIATGASNQETALALHIAVGTVKNHLKNIYGKLEVNSRTQAAARARTLGLIE